MVYGYVAAVWPRGGLGGGGSCRLRGDRNNAQPRRRARLSRFLFFFFKKNAKHTHTGALLSRVFSACLPLRCGWGFCSSTTIEARLVNQLLSRVQVWRASVDVEVDLQGIEADAAIVPGSSMQCTTSARPPPRAPRGPHDASSCTCSSSFQRSSTGEWLILFIAS